MYVMVYNSTDDGVSVMGVFDTLEDAQEQAENFIANRTYHVGLFIDGETIISWESEWVSIHYREKNKIYW